MTELDDIVTTQCPTHEAIDNALRTYLHFTTSHKEAYLQSEQDVARCTQKLLNSTIVTSNAEYVRQQIASSLLQEDDPPALHMIAVFLLYDGKSHEETFELMQNEGAFPRLIELLQGIDQGTTDMDQDLHRILLELLYQMSRVQRLKWEDLAAVNDGFVLYLFRIVEGLASDVDDPYHYHIIRVLLVLNEQYMVFSTTSNRVTNRVLKVLSTHARTYKTFGENLILLLNREAETSLQLLILKLLYLVFSNEGTAEYFYTNDLHVLTDVIMRNLLDLPSPLEDSSGGRTSEALRHTYLRVLHPLLANSQFKQPGEGYKPQEIRKVLRLLGHQTLEATEANVSEEGMSSSIFAHFAPTDATTLRLLKRCAAVEWLQEEEERLSPILTITPASSFNTPDLGQTNGDSPKGSGSKEVAGRLLLGMSAPHGAAESQLSINEMARQQEKPGVLSPSRARSGLGVDVGESPEA